MRRAVARVVALCAIASAPLAIGLCALASALPMAGQEAQQAAKKEDATKFRIAGRVVDKLSGSALPGTRVTIAQIASRSQPASVVTGDDGRFAFDNLEQGKYSLSAQRRGYPPQGFDAHDQYATAIVTGRDQDTEHLVFKLVPESVITGRVMDEMNEPVRNATVLLIRDGVMEGSDTTRVERQQQTDDQGAYRFSRVGSGKHYVAVAAQPWYAQHGFQGMRTMNAGTGTVSLPVPPQVDPALDVAYPLTYYPEATETSAATPIVLQPGSRFNADVTLHPVRALRMTVRGEAALGRFLNANLMERALEGYHVPAHSVGGGQREPGVVEISGIAPGHYQLSVRSFDPQNPRGGQTAWEREVDVTSDMEVDAGNPPPMVNVSGVLKYEDEEAERGARAQVVVQLRNVKSRYGAVAQMQPSGEFTFNPGLPPGTYNVLLAAPNVYVKSINASGAKVLGSRVEIGGSDTAQLTITASQGVGRVDGIALREDKGWAGAMVVLVPLGKSGEDARSLYRRDQSDSDGTFTLPNILPGKYAVLALANGWDIEWGNPAVLKQYLESAPTVEVAARGKYTVKVNVQP